MCSSPPTYPVVTVQDVFRIRHARPAHLKVRLYVSITPVEADLEVRLPAY
jgi:hypothetical protein